MKIFFTKKTALLFILSTCITYSFAAVKPPAKTTKSYSSSTQEGLIGVTEETPFDNPVDNIFHIDVEEMLCNNEQVWLEYELEGVEDHTSVSRSINDQRSVGGYLVKKRRGWALQRERIDGAWLHQGDNIIRFTLPEGALHNYRVRNVKIVVELANPSSDIQEKVVFNLPQSKQYYDSRAYIKGFIPAGSQATQVKVQGNILPIFKGEFEGMVDFGSPGQSCKVELELIYPDGSTSCEAVEFSTPQSADYTYAMSSSVFYTEKLVDTENQHSVLLRGSGITFEKNSVSATSLISITTLRDVDIPALDAGMVNVTANHYGFRFLPHGTTFLKEADIKIPFDATKIPDGYTEKDIKTYYFDEQAHHWIAVPTDTVLLEKGEIISKTTHFTDYINAIIKVPESPEAEAYNSTSMKGIKAANPTAAVNLINPPQANNTGSASLSYPINIPAGRGGMQPQLGINYNSGGGNGWMGLGWNLTIPSIGIETRWGVPRYDTQKETETYTMNGEQLTPLAHRDVLANRSTGDKQFYPRVEGAFNKIIRHGSSPANYYWEVTDKSGTKYFYGGSVSGYDKNSVLRTNEAGDGGNVAQWCLSEVRDLNGNTVKYYYTKVQDTGLASGTVPGHQIYISKITYTGFNGNDGPYEVTFTRETGRVDKSIMANLGFKQVTGDLLKKIEVKFDGKNIRHYELTYVTGEFNKSLLSKITEFDEKGMKFTKHEFDYYNDVRNTGGFKPLSETNQWTVPSDGISAKFKTNVLGFKDEATALSGTKSTDKNIGVGLSAGFGANVLTKKTSAGVSGGYSVSESEGLLVMIDMNGDGLQDKVFVDQNHNLFYHPNQLSKTGQEAFGSSPIAITGAGIEAFYEEKSKTVSYGAEAQFGAFVGYSKSKTTSKTSTYLTDVNGDQLPDIVKKGVVYFNHLDPDTGVVTYTRQSEGTPNRIFSSGTISGNLLDLQILEQEKQEAIDQNPLLDIVRMWKAPYSGTVKISAPVQLLPSTDPKRSEEPVDGVRVAVQHQNNELWHATIQENDYAPHDPALNNLSVSRGDMIFFRVGSRDNGSYDSVRWEPVIDYVNQPDLRDANGNQVYHFSAKDDYVITSGQAITPPFNGVVKVTGTLTKPHTTDDVLLLILKQLEDSQVVDTVWQKRYTWDEEVLSFPEMTMTVKDNEQYSFKAITETNIDWNAFLWRPRFTYTSADDPSIDLTKSPIEAFPIPEYSLFVNPMAITMPFHVALDSVGQRDTLSMNPVLSFRSRSFLDPPYNGEITFSVKKADTLLAKTILKITNGKITSDSVLTVPVTHDDDLFIEYHTASYTTLNSVNHYLAENLSRYHATFSIHGNDTTVKAGLYTVTPDRGEHEDVIFGPLYRGWGHFGWNGNREWAEQRINRDLLKLSEAAKNPSNINTDGLSGEGLESTGTYDAKKDLFFVLIATGENQRWISGDQFAYLTEDIISSSRLGDDDLSIIEVTTGDGSGAPGIDKISKSDGKAYTVSAAVVGKSHSYSTSRTLTDFMDMNGDRYPDIVSEKIIQYTNARGGLSDKIIPSLGFVQQTFATTDGTSLSGSFPMTMPKFRKSNKGSKPQPPEAGDAASTSGNASVNANVSAATGDSQANYSWLDINADGLPDRVNESDGKVALNLGYGFTEPELWSFGQIQDGSSDTKSGGAGLGFSKGQASVSAGFSLALSSSSSDEVLMDMNGDGLPDKVKKGNPVLVYINTGNGFATMPLSWTGATVVNEGATASESANFAFTYGFSWLGLKWTVSPNASKGKAMNRELAKFTDLNGDGYPDFVQSSSENSLTVLYSTIGRTNMLKSVKRPLGATFAIDYKQLGNTYEMPNNVWTLSRVSVYDGYKGDGPDSLLTTFAYEDGFHNRHEREFYGFKKVITNTHDTEKGNAVYTTVTQTFSNENYYEKGLMLNEVMTNGEGKKFVEKENVYQLKDITTGANLPVAAKESESGNAFPALIETSQKFYEGQSAAGKSTSMTFGYDTKGNVTTYTDFGDEGNDDNLSAAITYHNNTSLYLIGIPKSIIVSGSGGGSPSGGQGAWVRKRESVIDGFGNVTQIKQYLSDSEVATHDMEYDGFGNLTKITRPKNKKEERLNFTYQYDNVVHTYTTSVSNSYGYSSQATYDFRYGQVLQSTDINGNKISYELDAVGRVISITGPYENGGANKTIEFVYHPEDIVPWALTNHFDPANPKNKMQTAIFVDGLGRVLQTKKDAAIFDGEAKADKEVMVVSGRVKFDAFGRTTTAYYPVTEDKGDDIIKMFNGAFDTVTPTTTTYDVLNRTLSVTLPDGAVTKTEYGFASDRNGTQQFSTKTTDANDKKTEQFTDVRGRVSAVKNYTTEKEIWTSFKYNAINEQVEATDDLGHTTFSAYDNFGRRTERKHPDAGTTKYSYDLAGNLTQLVTANLDKDGLAIQYTYDRERLIEITYPQNPENNVKYTYGVAGATDNRAGRIVLQEDATGVQEFFYGPLGEVVKNIRTIVIPQFDEQTFVTEWTYDTWNRLTSMTYADGEKVDYTYNAGGLLLRMDGKKKNSTFSYVKQLGYDKFEQRVFLAYGNGTKTTYNYEPDRRRLKNMTAQTSTKRLFMDNVYTYDKVNNILSLKNNAPVPASNLMGGASEYTYSYDDLYRLTSATGSYKGANDEHSYTLAMAYNSVGGITQKTQNHLRKGVEEKKTTYNMSYTYSEEQPHAPVHIGEQTYSYDANGNQLGWTDDVSGQRRNILWDEENRMRAVYDNGALFHYIYDASGERILKGQSTGQRIFVNGEWKAGSGQMGNYTVYVNPYLVLKSGGYTKHYYIEGQRIVSKLGGGWDNNGKGPLKAGGSKVDYIGKTQRVFDGIVKNLKFLGADGQILTAGKSGKIPPGQINGSGNIAEAFRYFFHTDQLGSTSYVTDASGEVYQHLEYFAFGETFVEEHSNTNNTPFLFNGKELDEETRLYYYGARYYDPRTSAWLSVDPLTEKYPGHSSYIYALNNPVNLIDPDGRNVYKINQETGEITVLPTENKSHSYYLVGKDGKETFVGTFKYNDKGLIKLPSSFKSKDENGRQFGFNVKKGNEDRSYIAGDAMASLIGALAETGTTDLTINGFSLANGKSPDPSTSHKNGKNGDLRYLNTDYSGDKVLLGESSFDEDRQNTFNDALYKFGWKDMISEKYGLFNNSLLNHTSSAKARKIPSDHSNHLHLQGYAPNKQIIYFGATLPPVTITASKIK